MPAPASATASRPTAAASRCSRSCSPTTASSIATTARTAAPPTSRGRASRRARSADLTIEFYRRNYIEGLFLSSGIVRGADHTMELLVEVARILREEHRFGGYIHLKAIPGASEELVARAGLVADRLSVNIELPTAGRCWPGSRPTRTPARSSGAMHAIRVRHEGAAAERGRPGSGAPVRRRRADARRWSSARRPPGTARSWRAPRSSTRRTRSGASTTRPTARRRPPIPRLPLSGAAARARAPPLPGRLAHALLRLRRRGDRRRARRGPRRWTSTPSSPGRFATARSSRWT